MKHMPTWQVLTILVTCLSAAIAIVSALDVKHPAVFILLGSFLAGCIVWLVTITRPDRYLAQVWRRWRRRKAQKQELQWRLKLIEQWAQKWEQLAELIAQVIQGSDEPTDAQNEQFLNLRYWFIKNRNAVLPSWRVFLEDRPPGAHEHYDQYSLPYFLLVKNYQDPFSYFYQPLSLWALARYLKVQSEIPTSKWNPSEHRALEASNAIRLLSERVDEFVAWSKHR